MPQRFDTIELRTDGIETLPSGAIRVPAQLSRTGVFSYVQNGKVVREYRPPEEVLRADSVATAADIPATVGHPGMVRPGNWRTDTARGVIAGHVSAVSKGEAGVLGAVVIQAADVIAKVRTGALRDLSPGYEARIDETPGTTPDGVPYDRVQRDIKYNHVALLPPGGGRQGSSVSLRLDAAGEQLPPDAADSTESLMKIRITFDGKEHEVEAGSAEHLALQARVDAKRDAELATLRADNAKLTADLAAANEKVAKFDAAEKAAKRADLEARARKVLGPDAKFDGKSDREVQLAVIAKTDAEFKADGKSDDYVAARFDFACEKPASTRQDDAQRALTEAQRGGSGGGSAGGAGKSEEVDASKAQQARLDADRSAWQKPLAYSKP